jgi:hypothetical protein
MTDPHVRELPFTATLKKQDDKFIKCIQMFGHFYLAVV